MPDTKVIDVVFSSDESYSIPLQVAIWSTVRSAQSCVYNLHVFDCGLIQSSRERIGRLVEDTVHRVIFHGIQEQLAGLPITSRTHETISLASYARLLIPSLLQDVDRCIYLDCDVLVRAPLDGLYDRDLSSHPVAMARDMWTPYVSSWNGITSWEKLRFTAADSYFNSGVLVMDLRLWRRNNIAQECFAYLASTQTILQFDQEAINVVCHEAVAELPQRWNTSGYWHRQWFENIWAPPEYSPETNRATDAVAIVHYDGPGKPWEERGRGFPSSQLWIDASAMVEVDLDGGAPSASR